MNSTSNDYLASLMLYYRTITATVPFYGTIFMTFSGIVLNAFNIVIFNRKSFTNSIRFFYTALSCADLFSLINCAVIYFPWAFYDDLGTYSDFLCRLLWLTRRASIHISSWIQVLITMDRAFSILLNAKYKSIYGRKYLWLSLIGIIVFITAANSGNWFFLRSEIRTQSKNQTIITYRCASPSRQFGFFVNLIGFLLRAVIPFLFMFSLNIVLIYAIYVQKNKVNKLNKKELNFAITIISNNYLLLIFNMPLILFQIYEYLPNNPSDELTARLTMLRIIALYINYTYCALTFFFYLRFNYLFRKEVLKLISGSGRESSNVIQSNSANNTSNATAKNLRLKSKTSQPFTE
jgi:hypothetical protein